MSNIDMDAERAAFKEWFRDQVDKRSLGIGDETVALTAWQARAASPQATTVPADCDVRKILLRVVPGDGSGHEVYAKNVADVEVLLSEMGERLEDFELTRDAAMVVPQAEVKVSEERALTADVPDTLLVNLFYAAQGDITKFRIKARALLTAAQPATGGDRE